VLCCKGFDCHHTRLLAHLQPVLLIIACLAQCITTCCVNSQHLSLKTSTAMLTPPSHPFCACNTSVPHATTSRYCYYQTHTISPPSTCNCFTLSVCQCIYPILQTSGGRLVPDQARVVAMGGGPQLPPPRLAGVTDAPAPHIATYTPQITGELSRGRGLHTTAHGWIHATGDR
jgi:hypothetical protein